MDMIFTIRDLTTPGRFSGNPLDLVPAIRDADPGDLKHELSQLTYQRYLWTPYWYAVSTLVKNRARNRCQLCGSGGRLEAHHITYEHRNEQHLFLGDVTCLCHRCHSKHHDKPVEARAPDTVTVQAATARQNTETYDDGMVTVTRRNVDLFSKRKPGWHWLHDNGLRPQERGWKKRLIGRRVPSSLIQ